MLNPDAELNRLRSFLMMKNVPFGDIDTVLNAAGNDIDEAVLSIVSNAMVEAAGYATDIGADEFVDEIEIAEVGGSYHIVTRSGKTDYSIPEIKNLPNLLKNAETAEDGSRYKVIPVGGKNSNKIKRSIFEDQQALQAKIETARESLISRLNMKNSGELAERFREKMQQNLAARKSFYSLGRMGDTSPTQAPKFITASSKQDPETQWVIPAVNKDMTDYLMTINYNIEQDVRDTVITIIDEYERLF